MEEGQTVEIQETREPLREQGSIRALLELLEQQGMEQEKGDVLRMADYIDSMETLCGEHNPEGGTSGANTSFSGGRMEKKVCGTSRTGSCRL